ncbi:MAG: sensor histidine kinase [Chloroflexi bacterium]|nr:sensor histidine kinase [Chloroflexota bacterium]
MASTDFFLIVIFFIYGLAFFAMGLAVAIESRRSTAVVLASSLKYLAIFGLLHGAVEWLDMFSAIQSMSGLIAEGVPVRPIRVLLVAVSVVALLQFSVRLIIANERRHLWLRWLPHALFMGWLLSFVLPHVSWIPSDATAESAALCLQCHRGASAAYLALSSEWLTAADIWARYIMYLPASVLAGLAMLTMKPYFKTMGLSRLVRYADFAALAFVVNSFVAGVVVPPGDFFPASVLNYASFFAVVGIPPQVFRAGAALAIAYYIVRISAIFEIQQRRQLETAQKERIEAQQRLLESHREAHEQLERWSRELEEKVEQRTSEVEQRNRQVAILEERDRIAREMHDSLGQVLGYLGLKIIEIDQLLASDQVEQVRLGLRQMADAVHDCCADVRESILSLKTSISDEGGLVHALEEYLAKFGEQAGVKTEMVIENGVRDLQLAALAELQLLRIVQEALTNVRKHAHAHRAWVKIKASNGETSLVVEDDGRGFSLAQVTHQKGRRFGLQTMRERAEEIGAYFDVETSEGHGTKIIVRLPAALPGPELAGIPPKLPASGVGSG